MSYLERTVEGLEQLDRDLNIANIKEQLNTNCVGFDLRHENGLIEAVRATNYTLMLPDDLMCTKRIKNNEDYISFLDLTTLQWRMVRISRIINN